MYYPYLYIGADSEGGWQPNLGALFYPPRFFSSPRLFVYLAEEEKEPCPASLHVEEADGDEGGHEAPGVPVLRPRPHAQLQVTNF